MSTATAQPQRQVEGFTFSQDFSELIVVSESQDFQTYLSLEGLGILFGDGFESP